MRDGRVWKVSCGGIVLLGVTSLGMDKEKASFFLYLK